MSLSGEASGRLSTDDKLGGGGDSPEDERSTADAATESNRSSKETDSPELSMESGSDSETESFTDALENLHIESDMCETYEHGQTHSNTSESSTWTQGKRDTVNKDTNTSSDANPGQESVIGTDNSNVKTEQSSTAGMNAQATETGTRSEQEAEDVDRLVEEAVDEAKDGAAKEDEQVEEEETVIDEEEVKRQEAELSEEERQQRRDNAQEHKAKGNEHFKEGNFLAAIEAYTDALMICPMCYLKERSVMYSNRAAGKMKQDKNDSAIKDCSKALELNPNYMKALLRRADLHEKTNKLDEALDDYQKIVEIDPTQHYAREACMRLPDQIKERNEKMKEEMLGKLKDLGNMILKPFGLSTNNFNLQQDPNSGGYSVQFQQQQ